MAFIFDPELCKRCPYGLCIEDRRDNPVHGRSTVFRLKQEVAIICTFQDYVPFSPADPDPSRPFSAYLDAFRENFNSAGTALHGEAFKLQGGAISKVEGDVFELLIAASLWNAVVVWNQYMDTGVWNSSVLVKPAGAVPSPDRKVAVLKLPRNYDTTRLFDTPTRQGIQAFEGSLEQLEMELGLSSPDVVVVRLPHPLPDHLKMFMAPIPNFNEDSLELLATAHQLMENSILSHHFLIATAVKRTTRSDRLYQALFEANVLKFLVQVVLKGPTFRFHAYMQSLEGADVEGRYRAASLISLARGGQPSRAIDKTVTATSPAIAGQALLDDLPLFPTV